MEIITKWIQIPNKSYVKEHTFVFSDIHGMANELVYVLKYIKNKRCIFLGDVGDRGEYPLDCFKLLQDYNTLNICGNHDMFLKNIINDKETDKNLKLLLLNGGITLFKQINPVSKNIKSKYELYQKTKNISLFMSECIKDQKFIEEIFHIAYNLPDCIKEYIKSMNNYILENNILFVHAGINPYISFEENIKNAETSMDIDNGLCWIREPFLSYQHKIYNKEKHVYIIHGHTREEQIFQYNDCRIGLDYGIYSKKNKIAVLELKDDKMRIHCISF